METAIQALLSKVDISVQKMYFIKSQQADKEKTKAYLIQLEDLAKVLKGKYNQMLEILRNQEDTNKKMQILNNDLMYLMDGMESLETHLDAAPLTKREEITSNFEELTPNVEISNHIAVSQSKLPKKRLLIDIDLVTDDEFKKLPKYISRSGSLEVINKFVKIFNTTLCSKYEILGKKKSSLKSSEKREQKAYQDNEIAELRGTTYISNLDLARALGQTVLDKKSLNILIVLRHLSRIREHRKGSIIAYIT